MPRCENEYRQVAALRPHPATDLEPVHVRHGDIEDHHVDVIGQRLECRQTVRGGLDFVSLEGQGTIERSSHATIVVDDKDLRFVIRHFSSLPTRGHKHSESTTRSTSET